jgi:hypothetical protein
MTQQQVIEKYGEIVGTTWPDESLHCEMFEIPAQISEWVINTASGLSWTHAYVNHDMIAPLTEALQNIIVRGCVLELHSFDGCLMVRDIRGSPGIQSAHSWGMAIDLNASLMPLGSKSLWTDIFVKCFTDAGFKWGGNFSRTDPMHFSLTGF